MSADELNELWEAVKKTPENIPLRKYLIKLLLKQERFEEAEREIKEILKLAPESEALQLALASAFYGQQKYPVALVLLEEITSKSDCSAEAWLLMAKVYLQLGAGDSAKDAYEKAIIIKPALEDSFLSAEINLKNKAPEGEKIKLSSFGIEGDEADEKAIDIEKPKIDFNAVGGMEALKAEIRKKIIFPLEHPEIYKSYGKKIGGGILMYGPPGCGKTHLARATAGEINANFIPVGLSDILDVYLGQSERNLHDIFEKARSLKPCVLFFDEVDALGASRTDMRQSAARHVINQFLEELDGVRHSNDGVLVLAATNAPWHLDSAFRRPGRFDRIIFVPPPDVAARAAIFEIKMKDKPTESIDYSRLVKKTDDFSGADLEAIIDIAIESKLEASMEAGKALPLNTQDLEAALKRHKATTKEWLGTAKNYALFSNESGLYDDILKYLKLK